MRLLEAAPGLKCRAALSTAYGAGLRVSEVVALKVPDIDSMRMLLKIEQGKGRARIHGDTTTRRPEPLEMNRVLVQKSGVFASGMGYSRSPRNFP